MGAPIRYEFVSIGHQGVVSSFQSITSAAKQSKSATEGAFAGQERAARKTGGAVKSEADRSAQATQQAADKGAKAVEKAAQAEVRSVEKAAQAKAKAVEHVFQIKQRYLRQEEQAEERAARAREKASARASDGRWKMAGGLAVDGGKALVGGAVGLASGLVGGAAREAMKLQELTNRLSVASRGAGESFADPSALRKEFEAAAIANPGIKATDLAEGATNFVGKTGDLAAARKFSGTFATTASATGADVKDISDAAASLFKKFDIKTIDDMRESLAALTFQGKNGAFELKDAAAQFEKVGAAAQRWGVQKGVGGVRELGGLNQIAREATGSSEQAATSVEDMLSELIKHSKKLKGKGVDVFEKGSKSKTRNIQDVLVDLISKSKGSQVDVGAALGIQGVRGASTLLSAYNDAAGSNKGSATEKDAAGVSAMREVFRKAIDAQGNWAEVEKDAAKAQEVTSAQLIASWESIKSAVGAELLPTIAAFAASLKGGDIAALLRPAIVTFVALGEAAALAVDGLKFIGLLKEKTATPAEQLTTAQKALKDYDTSHKGIGAPTLAQVSERAALVDAVKVADGKMWSKASNGPLSAEGFVQRYGEADTRSPLDKILRAPWMALAALDPSNDFAQGAAGENDEQRRLRQDYTAGQSDPSRNGAGTANEAGAIKLGGDALTGAAAMLKEAAAALKAAKSITITGAPAVGPTG